MKRWRKTKETIAVLLATTVVGLAIGWNNIHSAVEVPWQFGFWLIASACLGFAFPRICWLVPAIFAYTMYIVHLWAIRHGFQPPNVERHEFDAIDWLFDGILPMFAGIAAGVIRFAASEVQHAHLTGKSLTYSEYKTAHSSRGGLLRASSKPEATPDDLLRPSVQSPASHCDELLESSKL